MQVFFCAAADSVPCAVCAVKEFLGHLRPFCIDMAALLSLVQTLNRDKNWNWANLHKRCPKSHHSLVTFLGHPVPIEAYEAQKIDREEEAMETM